jgi:hypothetical protein
VLLARTYRQRSRRRGLVVLRSLAQRWHRSLSAGKAPGIFPPTEIIKAPNHVVEHHIIVQLANAHRLIVIDSRSWWCLIGWRTLCVIVIDSRSWWCLIGWRTLCVGGWQSRDDHARSRSRRRAAGVGVVPPDPRRRQQGGHGGGERRTRPRRAHRQHRDAVGRRHRVVVVTAVSSRWYAHALPQGGAVQVEST